MIAPVSYFQLFTEVSPAGHGGMERTMGHVVLGHLGLIQTFFSHRYKVAGKELESVMMSWHLQVD